MTETITAVEVIVPCPSCARPMGSINNSWQCLACHPIPVDIPLCATQKCKKPLTKLGDPWNCWICLKCNDHPEEVNKRVKEDEQRKRTYIDKKVTPEEVQKIVDAAIAKALAEQRPDYPPTQAEIETMTAPETVNAEPEPREETYMQKAKRLGVPTHRPDGGGMLKKEDVLAGIAAKEIETAQAPPSEDAELARGMTEEDMMS